MRHLLILLFVQWGAAQDYNKPIKIRKYQNNVHAEMSACFKKDLLFIETKLESAFLGSNDGPMKDLVNNLITTANATYNGRIHLQHLTADEQPKGNDCVELFIF